MSVVVSFRIPKELKKKMDELRGLINWSEEIRRFIERRIKEYEQIRTIGELEEIVKGIPTVPKGTAMKYVREDRDSH